MFGTATIRLGIGPHSSWTLCYCTESSEVGQLSKQMRRNSTDSNYGRLA